MDGEVGIFREKAREASEIPLSPGTGRARNEAMLKPPRNFRPEPFAYHQEVEVPITDLSNLGQGVGRVGDWVVFVPYALPGERVRARIWRNKKGYSEGDLVGILEASPERVEPRCPLFGSCGGCQYQHYGYPAQLEWKRRQIGQLLAKMAGLEHPVNPCLGNPDWTYHYRSKITPHFRRPPEGEETPIGFQKSYSRAIVDVPSCPIASAAINAALPVERERLRSEKGRFRKGGTLLLRDSLEGVETDMRATVRERVGDYTFRFVAGEFFQNNPQMLPAMVDYAIDRAAGEGQAFLVDAYCGVGVFGICGHRRFQEVIGIEVSERAVELARENAAANGAGNISHRLGKAESLFTGLHFDAPRTTVLLDPPRKGCDPDFLVQLTGFHPSRIVYVSCGPDTQARDVRELMAAGYRVEDVQPIDLFPQTRHIETIVTLKA
jgi:23S rRNA (uracil1939-C5)-methyltransferase/tRNA (uracil-5-)-methyltransferase